MIQRETVYERVQYQFEDDAYDTLADLITYYVGSGKAISAASGARIQFPCNRNYPLSFYAAKYGSQFGQQCAGSRGVSPLNSPSLSNVGFRYVLCIPPKSPFAMIHIYALWFSFSILSVSKLIHKTKMFTNIGRIGVCFISHKITCKWKRNTIDIHRTVNNMVTVTYIVVQCRRRLEPNETFHPVCQARSIVRNRWHRCKRNHWCRHRHRGRLWSRPNTVVPTGSFKVTFSIRYRCHCFRPRYNCAINNPHLLLNRWREFNFMQSFNGDKAFVIDGEMQ